MPGTDCSNAGLRKLRSMRTHTCKPLVYVKQHGIAKLTGVIVTFRNSGRRLNSCSLRAIKYCYDH